MVGNSERVIFAAELFPHRSLSRSATNKLFLFFAALALIHFLFFVVVGAWIVFIFWGVDFLLLLIAFWLNNRAALVREYVEVRPDLILVRKLAPSGRKSLKEFSPFYTQFHVDRRGDFGIERMVLQDMTYSIELGTFLNPDDRESFARAFAVALARAKRNYRR